MSHFLLGVKLNTTSYPEATKLIISWAKSGESRCIYAANVHTVMEAYDSPEFRSTINSADLVTPDGMPLVWVLRADGYPTQKRVYGPTLMLYLLEAAAQEGITVGFIGSTTDMLHKLSARMQNKFPGLSIASQIAPPFRTLTEAEEQQIIDELTRSKVRLLFVSFGCPKQEYWIADHRGKIAAAMVGVGAAFAFHSGTVHQAPSWMQGIGLEWLFRMIMEPRRLWKRYFSTNPRFLYLITREMVNKKLGKS